MSKKNRTSGSGERNAMRGFTSQYKASAQIIYARLKDSSLNWIGVADRNAGVADDLVVGLNNSVEAYQFKSSQYVQTFRFETLFFGAEKNLHHLIVAWTALRKQFPNTPIQIHWVTDDTPSTTDSLVAGDFISHSAAFYDALNQDPNRSLSRWREGRWKTFIDRMFELSKMSEDLFGEFFKYLTILTHSDTPNHPNKKDIELIEKIAQLIPKLIIDPSDKDRWDRSELLIELGWDDLIETRHHHTLSVGAYVQRNIRTEADILQKTDSLTQGYFALLGTPGSGKSTQLQTVFRSNGTQRVVRYLAFMPSEGQGLGRAEASDFLNDINASLISTGLDALRFQDRDLHQQREQFQHLLAEAADRFRNNEIKTLIVVDGLDHIPREERPQRSLLSELPLPTAIPEGVVFVLGSQTLVLDAVPPAVRDQASKKDRSTEMESLTRDAIHRMALLGNLSADVNRDLLYEQCQGHPLVAHYMIEFLSNASEETLKQFATQQLIFPFEGDIELVYASAWRKIAGNHDAQRAMAILAHAEATIEPELIAQIVGDAGVEAIFQSLQYLLMIDSGSWKIFHNSFRLFVKNKPVLRFGKEDRAFTKNVYKQLAEAARNSSPNSAQHALELRYRARDGDHGRVLELATQEHFRAQLASGRRAADIFDDIRLASRSTKPEYDSAALFRLFLASDEIYRRSEVLNGCEALVEAYLSAGSVNSAKSIVIDNPEHPKAYEVVSALLDAGRIEAARDLFHWIEPIDLLLGSKGHLDFSDHRLLKDWLSLVIHFRSVGEILNFIDTACTDHSDRKNDSVVDVDLRSHLRLEGARESFAINGSLSVSDLIRIWKLSPEDTVYLRFDFANNYLKHADQERALLEITAITANRTKFDALPDDWKREGVKILHRLGQVDQSIEHFQTISQPSFSSIEKIASERLNPGMVRETLEHARISSSLGQPLDDDSVGDNQIPNHFHRLLVRLGSTIGQYPRGEVPIGLVCQVLGDLLVFLDRIKSRNTDDFYSLRQIVQSEEVLARWCIKLVKKTRLSSRSKCISFIKQQIERWPDSPRRFDFKRVLFTEIYYLESESEWSFRRLQELEISVNEDQPESQVECFAQLASDYIIVEQPSEAARLLAKIHTQTLGYSRPAKKDAQYMLWSDLLVMTNDQVPGKREIRTRLLVRQLVGMEDSEGRSAAERLAPIVLEEATGAGPSFAYAVAQTLATNALIPWNLLVTALLRGVLKRRPDMASSCAFTWASLALPYYQEPHYRESTLGEIIPEIVHHLNEDELSDIVDTLRNNIEIFAHKSIRSALLVVLRDACEKRDYVTSQLSDACVRWGTQEAHNDGGSDTTEDDMAIDTLEKLEEAMRDEELNTSTSMLPTESVLAQAEATEVFKFLERHPLLLEKQTIRRAVIEIAYDARMHVKVAELLSDYLDLDRHSSWSYWSGAQKYHFHQLRQRVEFPYAEQEAFEDLADAFASSQVSLDSLPGDTIGVFSLFPNTLPIVAMWDSLENYLLSSRDYENGHYSIQPKCIADDEELLAELFLWAFRLGSHSVSQQARAGLKLCYSQCNARPVANTFIKHAIDDQMLAAEALRLLIESQGKHLWEGWQSDISVLVNKRDIVVAIQSRQLLEKLSLPVKKSKQTRSAFYDFEIPGDSAGEREIITDADFEPMGIDDPLGWTKPFLDIVKLLSRQFDVPEGHIRYRCAQFIEQWGGVEVFGKPASKTQDLLHSRLSLRIDRDRPHLSVGLHALRNVAGELFLASDLNDEEALPILFRMGQPCIRPEFISATPRPECLRFPKIPKDSWGKELEEWVHAVGDDEPPRILGGHQIIAELSRFYVSDMRYTLTMDRVSLSQQPVNIFVSLDHCLINMPDTIYDGSVRATYSKPSACPIVKLTESALIEFPAVRITLCPFQLRTLGWLEHPDNNNLFVDRNGSQMVRILYWNDGNRIDAGMSNVWGNGILVYATQKGIHQLFPADYKWTLFSRAWRTCKISGSSPKESSSQFDFSNTSA